MSTKRKALTAAFICLFCALFIMGCAGSSNSGTQDSKSTSQSITQDSLIGFWEIEPDSALGLKATLNLLKDGFAELDVADAYMQGIWSIKDSKATIEFEDKFGTEPKKDKEEAANAEASTQTADLYISGDKLVMGRDNGSKLVFVKSDITEYYANDPDAESVLLKSKPSESKERFEIVDEAIEDIEPVTVADDEFCKIVVTGKGTDYMADPTYRLSVENKTNKAIRLLPDGMFTVDGNETQAIINEIIETNYTADASLSFSADALGGGAEKLKQVKGKIVVYNEDTSEKLASYSFEMN